MPPPGSDRSTSIISDQTVDALKISNDLSSLAEDSTSSQARCTAFAVYLQKLLNAAAILVFEPRSATRLALMGEIWKEGGIERKPDCAEQIQAFIEAQMVLPEAFVQEMPGNGSLKQFAICAPVMQNRRLRAYVVALLGAENKTALSPFVIILQTAGGYLNYYFECLDRTEESWALNQSTALIDIFSHASVCENFSKAAQAMASGLAQHVGCFRVCLGILKRKEMSLVAISGTSQFEVVS